MSCEKELADALEENARLTKRADDAHGAIKTLTQIVFEWKGRAERAENALATMRPFFDKHALGALAKPSCLCCGRNDYKIVAVQHAELPGIVICDRCKRAEADLAKLRQRAESAEAELAKLKSEMASLEQALTDPENQPSQFGTVTLEWHEAELAKLRQHAEVMADELREPMALNDYRADFPKDDQ